MLTGVITRTHRPSYAPVGGALSGCYETNTWVIKFLSVLLLAAYCSDAFPLPFLVFPAGRGKGSEDLRLGRIKEMDPALKSF